MARTIGEYYIEDMGSGELWLMQDENQIIMEDQEGEYDITDIMHRLNLVRFLTVEELKTVLALKEN